MSANGCHSRVSSTAVMSGTLTCGSVPCRTTSRPLTWTTWPIGPAGTALKRVEAAVDDVQRVGDAAAADIGHRRPADEGRRRLRLVAAVGLDADVVLDRGQLERHRVRLGEIDVQVAGPVARADCLRRAAVALGVDVELCVGRRLAPEQRLLEQRQLVE